MFNNHSIMIGVPFMYDKLTIQERIRDLRQEKKLTLEQLADATGLSKSALGSYESNETKDISHYAIIQLAKFYGVTTDYLLGVSEQKTAEGTSMCPNPENAEICGYLSGKKLNRRLLQELISHEDFPRLLADIEIYIDNIAGMQIKNLNAWIDVVRQELIEKYNPDKDDTTLRVLEAAHIHDDEYFSHLVNEDIDRIIHDLREKHSKDATSAPEESVAEQMKKDLEEVASFKGSKLEKQLIVYCKQLKIDYKKLTPEEFRVFIQILRKSKLYRSGGRGR